MIAILLDGGLVTDVITDNPKTSGPEVLIIDYDIEGACEEDLTEIVAPGGHRAMAAVHTETIQRTGLNLRKIKADSQAVDPRDKITELLRKHFDDLLPAKAESLAQGILDLIERPM